MTSIVGYVVDSVAVLVLLHGAWWSLLSLVAIPRPRRRRPMATMPMRMAVVVPAHNERFGIERCVRSVTAAATDPTAVIVVADNCTDDTADIARRCGATVIERHDLSHIGKSYALETAICYLATAHEPPDAVVFVDGDSEISANALVAIDDRLQSGAEAVQLHYATAQGTTSLGRLRTLAFSLVHWSRPLGAARLGVPTTLRGNGMAVRWRHAAGLVSQTGLAEDAAMSIYLARQSVAVEFEPRASVTGYMAQDYRGARTQDERWERGRASLVGRAISAAVDCIRRRRVGLAVAMLDLATPPVSLLLGLTMIAGGLSVGLGLGRWPLALAALGSLATYLLLGLLAARARQRDLSALLSAPKFFVYKLYVLARLTRRRDLAWERTERPD